MTQLFPGESLSLWKDTCKIPRFPKLTKNLRADVAVVGGGIAGLTTAYLLARKGKSVVLLESAEIGSGQTGKTTAHITYVLDDRYYNLERIHGQKATSLAAQSHQSAIQQVQDIVLRENFDCHLESVTGYLLSYNEQQTKILEKELSTFHRYGFNQVSLHKADSGSPLIRDTHAYLKFPNQLQIHALKYIAGLSSAITKLGGKIYAQTHVTSVHGGEKASVVTNENLKVYCDSVVVATNSPINNLFALHTKQAPYRTYVLGFSIPKQTTEKSLYWDILDPYHYVRFQTMEDRDHDLLIVGGEDHKTGQDTYPADRYEALEKWTRKGIPQAEELLYRWSGQVMETVDGLAFLGHNPMDEKNVYVISGDSGNGTTHATIGAMIITDQILGEKNPWEEVYAPHRIHLMSTGPFLKENLNVAVQYADWLKSSPPPKFTSLKKDSGVVFRDGLKMVAAYKGKSGEMEFFSAACPHLGGVLHWNSVEHSWDCPCHGSRFDCHGKVIEGPAYKDLSPYSFNKSNQ